MISKASLFASSCTLAATLALADEVPRGPLPQSVEPTHYRLEFTVLPQRKSFSARTEISVRNEERTRRIWLHGSDLHVTEAHVVDSAGRRIGARYRQVDDLGVAELSLQSALEPGEAKLFLKHEAAYNTGGYGSGVSRMEYSGRTYVATMMFATSARSVFPGFDEPRFKTPYDISVIAPAGQVVVSNGPETHSEPLAGALKRVSFATTRPTATYLVGFWVGDYSMSRWSPIPPTAQRGKETQLRALSGRGRAAALGIPLASTAPIVTTIESYLDVAYPYDKLDLVVIPDPDERGGMENAAAPSFGADVQVDEQTSLVAQREAVSLLAHEIVHQWFGDLATPTWWDHFWINEAHATWLTERVNAMAFPGRDFERMPQRRAIVDMDIDSRLDAQPIAPRIETTAGMRLGLNQLMYAKGNGVLAMFEHYVGPQAYRRGLQTYLKRFADRAASSEDFLAALEEGSGVQGVGAALRTFIDRPGVPFLRVDWKCADGKLDVDVAQSRYAFLGSRVEPKQQWQVPFCAAWSEGSERRSRCALLRRTRETISFPVQSCPATVMPNAEGAGYYRFELPKDKFAALLSSASELGGAEALALADSFGAAFAAGKISAREYLAALPALASHPAWDVVAAPVPRLETILSRSSPESDREGARKQVREAYAGAMQRLGVRGDSDMDRRQPDEAAQLREVLVPFMALHAKDETVRTELVSVLNSSGVSSSSPPSQTLTRAALVTQAQKGGDAAVESLLQQLRQASADDGRREDLLAAIGSVSTPAAADRARALVLSKELSAGETMTLLTAHAAVPENVPALWAWQRSHLSELLARLKGGYDRFRLVGLSGRLCTRSAIDEVRQTFAPHAQAIPMADRAIDAAVDNIAQCAALTAGSSADSGG